MTCSKLARVNYAKKRILSHASKGWMRKVKEKLGMEKYCQNRDRVKIDKDKGYDHQKSAIKKEDQKNENEVVNFWKTAKENDKDEKNEPDNVDSGNGKVVVEEKL
ncbi:hypothetical protein F8M41_026542 [Gigaspora margarita]|uniref:Uncharacterized protein n=1 Tax=Gigaspora margarita TaxID=4874 RepID=A0A8H3XGK6_GIGMA|nr:hypothetical protein F8M41_026542 [Gigaspora margarita]